MIAEAASTDLGDALARIDGYKAGEVHVTRVDGTVAISRGQRQAFLRKVELPRTIRKGTRKVRATVVLRHVRGARETRRVTVKLPRLRPGRREVVFVGKDVDFSEGDLFEIFGFDFGSAGGSLGPANLARARPLRRGHRALGRRERAPAAPRPERLRGRRPQLPRRGPADLRQGAGLDPRQAALSAARTSAGVSGSARKAAASAAVRRARSWRRRPTSAPCSRATVNGLPVSSSARGCASAARYQSPSSVGP